jgi:hypothetical protein
MCVSTDKTLTAFQTHLRTAHLDRHLMTTTEIPGFRSANEATKPPPLPPRNPHNYTRRTICWTHGSIRN